MTKKTLGKNYFVYPMPVALLGTRVHEKVNFMTLSWFSRVNSNPPLIAIAITGTHYTTGGIRQNQTFSINYPPSTLRDKVEYCGQHSGREVDKSEVFSVFYGQLKTAPMIAECVLCMECRVEREIALPSNVLIIGQIVQTYADEQIITNGRPDLSKMEPLLLTMPDNTYWSVKGKHSDAWTTFS